MNDDPIFTDDALIYAATARCHCGAGLAYVRDADHRNPASVVGGAWFCSALLTGRADPGPAHDKGYPFTFYEVKSEGQPSADGMTTRPTA